jgi:DNA-binding NarL/FixJ family response regulator
METPIRLAVVAADPLVRSTLSRLLHEANGCEVVLSLDPDSYLSSAEDEIQETEADLVLWDLGWEPGDLAQFDFQEFDIPVAALVIDDDQAVEAWNSGARAVLSRQFETNDLYVLFSTAAKGMAVIDLNVAGSLLPAQLKTPSDLDKAPTTRELQVLQLLAEGLTNRAIAARLDISEHTVKFHINAILKKLDAQSRTEAVVIATRLGFIVL